MVHGSFGSWVDGFTIGHRYHRSDSFMGSNQSWGLILSRGLPLPRGQGVGSTFSGVLPVFITERFPPVLRLFIRGRIQG